MKSSEVISKLEAEGWRLDRIRGSHHYFKKPDRRMTVCVPHPKKDLPVGTLKNIERQSGLRLK